jgi:hypothetical protein
VRDIEPLAERQHPLEHGAEGLTRQIERPRDDGQMRLDRAAVSP